MCLNDKFLSTASGEDTVASRIRDELMVVRFDVSMHLYDM